MSNQFITKEINSCLNTINSLNNKIKELENLQYNFDILNNKYSNLTVAKNYNNEYIFLADLDNLNDKELFFNNQNSYFERIKDKETEFYIYSLFTTVNGIYLFDTDYDPDDLNSINYNKYIIYIIEDLYSLSKRFKDHENTLSIFKSNLLKLINDRPKGSDLEIIDYKNTKPNSKIIKSIKENLIFI